MIEYASIYLKKQNVEYARILNVSDIEHKVRLQITEQLSIQRRIQNTLKHLRQSVLQKKAIPECRYATKNFQGRKGVGDL